MKVSGNNISGLARRLWTPLPPEQDLMNASKKMEAIPECVSRIPQMQLSRSRYIHEHFFLQSLIPYRGFAKNTHWLFISCGLANLYVARRRLLAGA